MVVGISGFGGSGKSTLARRLITGFPERIRLRGDDFLDPVRSHRRSSEWDGVDRERLAAEVLIPFRDGKAARFRRYDWSLRTLGAEEALDPGRVLVVDAIGLFHPECMGLFDLTVWVDVGLETATARGKARDEGYGRDHGRLWDDVWVPNEQAFVEGFDPRSAADLLYAAE